MARDGNSLATILRRADDLLQWLEKAGAAVCGVAIFIMVGLTTVDVVLRYFFNAPLIGAYEVMEFLLVGVTFLSFAYVQRVKGHVGMDILLQKLGRKGNLILEVVGCLLALGCLWAAVWQTASEAWDAFVTGDYIGEIVRLYYWPPKTAIALGLGLFCLTLISTLVQDIAALTSPENGQNVHDHKM